MTNNNINYFYFAFFVLTAALLSCNSSTGYKKLPEGQTYFLFKYTREIIDSNTDATVNYELLDFSKSEQEKDTLVVLLKKFGWDYKITIDNEIFISTNSLNNLDNLFFLTNELEKSMKVSKK